MSQIELRCEAKLHGILLEPDLIEVGCSSRICGAGGGVVVRHRFRLSTGELVSTRQYKQPPTGRSTGNDTA